MAPPMTMLLALSRFIEVAFKPDGWDGFQLKAEGITVFLPYGVKLMIFVGTTLMVSNGVSFKAWDTAGNWCPFADGGSCWWVPVFPYVVFMKGQDATFWIHANGRYFKIQSYQNTKLEPSITQVESDWETPTGVMLCESTWPWVKNKGKL